MSIFPNKFFEPMDKRPPLPPFTYTTALKKVSMLEEDWNMGCARRLVFAYSKESRWHVGGRVIAGRHAIGDYLASSMSSYSNVKMKKYLSAFISSKIVVTFDLQYQDIFGKWQHTSGSEILEYDPAGHISRQVTTILKNEPGHCKLSGCTSQNFGQILGN
ncbi:MAG: DUF1348 family protein [Sphingobacteriales bacterium]|nr:MAG: DUF1348 family protein [Sphingobacteriales bacterium]